MSNNKLYLIAPIVNASDQVLELQSILDVEIQKITIRQAEILFYDMHDRDRFYEIGHYFNSTDDAFYLLAKEIDGPGIEIENDGYPTSGNTWPGEYLKDADRLFTNIKEKASLINVISEAHFAIPEVHIVYKLDNTLKYRAVAQLGGYRVDLTTEQFKIIHPELLSFIKNISLYPFPKFIAMAIQYLDQSYLLRGSMSFLSILIAFEVLFNPGKDQIRYTISRNTAVLIGTSVEESMEIFENMKKAYALRSGVVHAGDTDFKKLLKFNNILVSYLKRTISSLLGKRIDKDELLLKLTIASFGNSPFPLPYVV